MQSREPERGLQAPRGRGGRARDAPEAEAASRHSGGELAEVSLCLFSHGDRSGDECPENHLATRKLLLLKVTLDAWEAGGGGGNRRRELDLGGTVVLSTGIFPSKRMLLVCFCGETKPHVARAPGYSCALVCKPAWNSTMCLCFAL